MVEENTPQAIRDALNLTTLVRWGARFGGSFKIGKDEENLWRVVIMRRGDLIARKTPEALIVFASSHADISIIVGRAADAIKRTAEWGSYDARKLGVGGKPLIGGPDGDGVGKAEKEEGEVIEYDYDIWKAEAQKRGDYGSVMG